MPPRTRDLALACVLASPCALPSVPAGGPRLAVRSVDEWDRPEGQWPRIAVGANGLDVAWTRPEAGGHALEVATARIGEPDDSLLFEGYRTIAAGTDWFVNWADFPALARDSNGARVATWLERTGDGYAYHVHYASTLGDGLTWSAGRRLHDDDAATEHGFVSLAALPTGGFAAVWLDGRDMAGEDGSDHDAAENAHGGHGSMALYSRRIAPGADSGETGALGPEVEVDGRVCECCQTDLVALGDGTLVVAYRDRSAGGSHGEVRDIALRFGRAAESGAIAWSEAALPFADHWSIPGCPVNGPALDAQGEQLALAWFTSGTGRPLPPGDFGVARARVAFSADGGRSFGAPVELGNASTGGRVDVVLLDGDTAVASWLDGASPASWRARALARDGEGVWTGGPEAVVGAALGGRSAGFLRLGRLGETHALAVWTSTDPPSGKSGRLERLAAAVLTPE